MTDQISWNLISGSPKQNIYIVEIQIEIYRNLLKHNWNTYWKNVWNAKETTSNYDLCLWELVLLQ